MRGDYPIAAGLVGAAIRSKPTAPSSRGRALTLNGRDWRGNWADPKDAKAGPGQHRQRALCGPTPLDARIMAEQLAGNAQPGGGGGEPWAQPINRWFNRFPALAEEGRPSEMMRPQDCGRMAQRCLQQSRIRRGAPDAAKISSHGPTTPGGLPRRNRETKGKAGDYYALARRMPARELDVFPVSNTQEIDLLRASRRGAASGRPGAMY
jgi:hypothetical protein